ncbi:MAG: DUF1206 domain-containing protein, partial [Pseudonocardia sp.]|nr:DUF1206 domain-containing protein [Pseudonocardia sp.]
RRAVPGSAAPASAAPAPEPHARQAGGPAVPVAWSAVAQKPARGAEGSVPIRLGARCGLVAYGVVHLLVAWLAVRVAFGRFERADPEGALQTVAGEPFGRELLWLIVAGFGAVVVWRVRESIWGFNYVRRADRPRKRLFAAGQAVVFGALGVLAARIAGGSSSGSGGEQATARLLELPAGRAVVTVVGAGVLVGGMAIALRGWRMAFTEDMDLERAGPLARTLAERTGQVGSVAKGVAVGIIGVLVVVAGMSSQPARAEGLDAALKTLAVQPYGTVLLTAVALGLASYGLFSILDACYHRV